MKLTTVKGLFQPFDLLLLEEKLGSVGRLKFMRYGLSQFFLCMSIYVD